MSSLTGFSETLRRKGYEPGTKWLERTRRFASADEVVRLGLSPDAEAFNYHVPSIGNALFPADPSKLQ